MDNTTNDTDTNFTGGYTLALIKTMYLTFVMLVGFFGNLTCFICYICSKALRQKTCQLYLQSLVIANLIFVMALVPELTNYINGFNILKYPLACKLFPYLNHTGNTLASYFTVLFTIERFVVVFYPFKRRMCITQGKTITMILITTVFSFVYNSHRFYTVGVETTDGEQKCIVTQKNIHSVFDNCDMIVRCVIPFCLLTVLNSSIASKLYHRSHHQANRHISRMLNLNKQQTAMLAPLAGSTSTTQTGTRTRLLSRLGLGLRSKGKKIQKEVTRRVNWLLVGISLSYFCFNFPGYSMRTLQSTYCDWCRESTLYTNILHVVICLYYTQPCINFLFYASFYSNWTLKCKPRYVPDAQEYTLRSSLVPVFESIVKMVEGTVPKIIKCLMSFICSLLMSLGLTVMIFSICALHIEDMKKNVELAEEDLIAFAVMGGITFVVGFLGCFGACCENRILLCLFFALVTLLFIIELALAFSILLKKDEKGRELGWGFLGLAIFHFIGAVFSMILCVAITREQRDGGGQDVA